VNGCLFSTIPLGPHRLVNPPKYRISSSLSDVGDHGARPCPIDNAMFAFSGPGPVQDLKILCLCEPPRPTAPMSALMLCGRLHVCAGPLPNCLLAHRISVRNLVPGRAKATRYRHFTSRGVDLMEKWVREQITAMPSNRREKPLKNGRYTE
jgi:hypothetical protein